jgi:hypothetical protein
LTGSPPISRRRCHSRQPDATSLEGAAAAQAGNSIAARDLSLLLDRALNQPRPVAFRRAELRTLVEIAMSADLGEVAGRLDGAAEASG